MSELPEHLFLGIDHVGIAVPNLDEAIGLYCSYLGMHLAHEETNEEQGVREAMLKVAGRDASDADPQLQLLAPLSEDSTIAKFIDKSGPGLQQIAYRVEDADHASNVLRDRGFRMLYDRPKRGTGGSSINFIHPKDVGGVLVEIVEH